MIKKDDTTKKAVQDVMNNGLSVNAVMKKHKIDKISLTVALAEERQRIDEFINQTKPVEKKVTFRVYEEDKDTFTTIAKHLGENQRLVFHHVISCYLAAHPEVLAKEKRAKAVAAKPVAKKPALKPAAEKVQAAK